MKKKETPRSFTKFLINLPERKHKKLSHVFNLKKLR